LTIYWTIFLLFPRHYIRSLYICHRKNSFINRAYLYLYTSSYTSSIQLHAISVYRSDNSLKFHAVGRSNLRF